MPWVKEAIAGLTAIIREYETIPGYEYMVQEWRLHLKALRAKSYRRQVYEAAQKQIDWDRPTYGATYEERRKVYREKCAELDRKTPPAVLRETGPDWTRPSRSKVRFLPGERTTPEWKPGDPKPKRKALIHPPSASKQRRASDS